MPQTSPNLNLPFLQPSQAQKHVTHNEALQILDAVTQLRLEGRDATTPPVVPSDGEVWALGGAPTGVWAGAAQQLAVFANGAWLFLDLPDGTLAWDKSTGALIVRSGGSWQSTGGASNPQTLGINTSADTTNRLAVASGAVLFSHEGAGHQLKINKAAETDTASLLYQTGFSGRAEMGLAGADDWSIKVSADGSAWITALQIAASDGAISGDSVQSGPNDTGTGKLARADYAYCRGNLVGTVSEAAGQPTGAVIEQGSNAAGNYTRLADGTQICWTDGLDLVFETADRMQATWTFPQSFAAAPCLSATLSASLADLTDVSFVDLGQVASDPGLSAAGIKLYRSAGASALPGTAEVRNLRVLAIGRWF